jgi:hypothetical protein
LDGELDSGSFHGPVGVDKLLEILLSGVTMNLEGVENGCLNFQH